MLRRAQPLGGILDDFSIGGFKPKDLVNVGTTLWQSKQQADVAKARAKAGRVIVQAGGGGSKPNYMIYGLVALGVAGVGLYFATRR